MNIEELQEKMNNMHKKIKKSESIRRERAILENNRNKNSQKPNFQIGNMVLLRRQDKVVTYYDSGGATDARL